MRDEDVKERLKYFASHPSGFDVADYDLQRRGPGEVYGIRQSGIPTFKVASIHI
jgi:ATP-dependent DNA helicase RecG